MPSFQSVLSDAKFVYDFQVGIFNFFFSITYYCLQDQSDNFCLLNSLLNFDDSPRKDTETVAENVTDKDTMEWLDLVDFKEEPNDDDERNSPEKNAERKRKHNQSEFWSIIM